MITEHERASYDQVIELVDAPDAPAKRILIKAMGVEIILDQREVADDGEVGGTRLFNGVANVTVRGISEETNLSINYGYYPDGPAEHSTNVDLAGIVAIKAEIESPEVEEDDEDEEDEEPYEEDDDDEEYGDEDEDEEDGE